MKLILYFEISAKKWKLTFLESKAILILMES